MCSVCLFLIISLITKAKPHKQLKCKHQRISQQQLGTTHTHTDRVKHRTGIIEAEQADTMLMVLVVLVGGLRAAAARPLSAEPGRISFLLNIA